MRWGAVGSDGVRWGGGLLRNRGLVESGDSIIREGGFKFFINCSSEKHVFITTGILNFLFLSTAVINKSILSCGLLSTRK